MYIYIHTYKYIYIGKTAEDGARTPAMLALMKENISGKFFSSEKVEAW
jgi:hypothetical protein